MSGTPYPVPGTERLIRLRGECAIRLDVDQNGDYRAQADVAGLTWWEIADDPEQAYDELASRLRAVGLTPIPEL